MNRQVVGTQSFDAPHDLLTLVPPRDFVVWVGPGVKLVGWGLQRLSVVGGPDPFSRASKSLRSFFDTFEVRDELQVPGTGPVAFASFPFDEMSGATVLAVPNVVVGVSESTSWVTTIGDQTAPTRLGPPETPVPKIRYAGASVAEIEWLEAVEAAIGEIKAARLEKVVLARDVEVWAEETLDVRSLAARLTRRFPECYTFVSDGLVGATPELLAKRAGMDVESLVLAGSARRAVDAAEDDVIGKELLESAKDAREHQLSVRSVAGVYDDICEDLHIDSEPWLLKLANVQHLATSLSGRLRKEVSALEIAGLLHPTAAVCGTPTSVALDTIRRLERMDRGRYTGPVGWMDAAGNGEFGIALRCAEVRDTRARLFAGNGIVQGSVPEMELEETRLKLRAMQSALEG